MSLRLDALVTLAGCERGPSGPAATDSKPSPEKLETSKLDVPISFEMGFLASEISKRLPNFVPQIGNADPHLPV
jgi:hypothetical protein